MEKTPVKVLTEDVLNAIDETQKTVLDLMKGGPTALAEQQPTAQDLLNMSATQWAGLGYPEDLIKVIKEMA